MHPKSVEALPVVFTAESAGCETSEAMLLAESALAVGCNAKMRRAPTTTASPIASEANCDFPSTFPCFSPPVAKTLLLLIIKGVFQPSIRINSVFLP
jgi:hypothetical protein